MLNSNSIYDVGVVARKRDKSTLFIRWHELWAASTRKKWRKCFKIFRKISSARLKTGGVGEWMEEYHKRVKMLIKKDK